MRFDSESSPGFAIGRVAYQIRSEMATVLKGAGWPFSPEETQTLITLLDAGEPLSMNELASLMIRDPTTVKRQLDRLVEHQPHVLLRDGLSTHQPRGGPVLDSEAVDLVESMDAADGPCDDAHCDVREAREPLRGLQDDAQSVGSLGHRRERAGEQSTSKRVVNRSACPNGRSQ